MKSPGLVGPGEDIEREDLGELLSHGSDRRRRGVWCLGGSNILTAARRQLTTSSLDWYGACSYLIANYFQRLIAVAEDAEDAPPERCLDVFLQTVGVELAAKAGPGRAGLG